VIRPFAAYTPVVQAGLNPAVKQPGQEIAVTDSLQRSLILDAGLSTKRPQFYVAPPVETGAEVSSTKPLVETHVGRVLGADKLLVWDDFPGRVRSDLSKDITYVDEVQGLGNFRKLKDAPIYGLAQPDIQGVRKVLDSLAPKSEGEFGSKVLWANMREEAFVYIDGNPYSIRAKDAPCTNSKNPSFEGSEVEALERQLKQDVLEEARLNGGKILLHRSEVYPTVEPVWVDINDHNVQTVKEVFDDLKSEGYRLDYRRIPIGDEEAAEVKDFDEVTRFIAGSKSDQKLVFNCQAGKGRTTTGMMIAEVCQRNDEVSDDYVGPPRTGQRAPSQSSYGKVKHKLDKSLADGAALTDLRASLSELKQSAQGAGPEKINREIDFVVRYRRMLAFESYMSQPSDKREENFQRFLDGHPGLHITRPLVEFILNHS
jgi:protein-tyrosine phosphatase